MTKEDKEILDEFERTLIEVATDAVKRAAKSEGDREIIRCATRLVEIHSTDEVLENGILPKKKSSSEPRKRLKRITEISIDALTGAVAEESVHYEKMDG